jgi:hypothetical protein
VTPAWESQTNSAPRRAVEVAIKKDYVSVLAPDAWFYRSTTRKLLLDAFRICNGGTTRSTKE